MQRVVKFCKYLPQFGFKPVVITPQKPDGSFFIDEELAAEVPGDIEVRRSFSLEPYHIYRALGGRRKQDEADLRRGLSSSKKYLDPLKKLYFTLQAAFLVPDAKIGWYPWAVADGARVIRERGIAAILSTSPEATDHVIGRALGRRFGIPLILDFRDPWTMSHYSPRRPSWARRRDENLELKCLKQAARVVCVQQKYIDDFKEKYPELLYEGYKYRVIRNGFDPDDFNDLTSIIKDGFNVVYTGSISYPRDPEPFFRAFANTRAESSDFAEEARCTFIGEFDTRTLELVRSFGLDDVVEFLPYSGHRTALAHQLGADALLLVSEGYITAKVYEYLGARRPIICLTEGEELRQLVTETGSGVSFLPSEWFKMEEYMLRLFDESKRGKPVSGPVPDSLLPYTRREQAKMLADLLAEVTGG